MNSAEERLRAALQARAELVTPQNLRPAEPPAPRRPRSRWIVPVLAGAAAMATAVVGYVVVSDQNETPAPADTTTVQQEHVTEGTCPREVELIERALSKSTVNADVDGDGTTDQVAVVTDDSADPGCRAFVGVRLSDGSTYSAALDPAAVPPPGFPAEIVGVPDLGDDPGAEIVVDTHSMADSMVAQLFTFTEDGLVRVPIPATENGTFVVEGGGITAPSGADCTAQGDLVLSTALINEAGDRYEVTRQVYGVTGDALQLTGPEETTRTVDAASLADDFPEFLGPHFEACTP